MNNSVTEETVMKKAKTSILVIITAFLFAVSAILSFVIFKSGADFVEIYEDGALIGRYPISENRTIKLSHNTVKIEGGAARMDYADCENQICVGTGSISTPLYPIVCLPNRVLVRVSGGGGIDAAAGD